MKRTTMQPCLIATLAIASLLAAIRCKPAEAMTIDIFTATQGPADDTTFGGGGQLSTMPGPQAGNVVPASGRRELFAEKTNAAIGRARLEVNFDALFYASSSGVSGQFEVSYLDLGGIDLSFGDGLTIHGELDAAGASGGGTLIGLFVEDVSNNFGRSDVLLNTSGGFTHLFEKTDFAGVDFSQVKAIRLGSFDAATGAFADVPVGGDLILTSFEVTAVPEPGYLLPTIATIVSFLTLLASLRHRG